MDADFHSAGANLRNVSVPARLYPDWLLRPRREGESATDQVGAEGFGCPFSIHQIIRTAADFFCVL